MRALLLVLGALVGVAAFGCGDSTDAPPSPAPETRERERPAAPPADPGPRVWRPAESEEPREPTPGGGGTGMRRERRRRTLTSAEIQARLASLRSIDTSGSACEQAFEALRTSREGLGDLLDEDRMGGPNRADYLALCRALPPDVQRCFTPSHQQSHRAECDAVLRRFGEQRDDPAWLTHLSGRPASDRPPPATTEEEARALRRRR